MPGTCATGEEEAYALAERRIGAYGGTFDPIHSGHIEVARAVARHFKLDELLIIPAHIPPHKDRLAISDAYHRYAMAVLATMDEPRLRVSTLEIESPGEPYTFQTIERLRGLYGPQAKLFFVIGADSFEDLRAWREPERLLRTANWIVAARPGHKLDPSSVPAEFRSSVVDLQGRADGATDSDEPCCRIYLTDYVSRDISSTQIRQRAYRSLPVRDMVPAGVAEYIEKYELYRR